MGKNAGDVRSVRRQTLAAVAEGYGSESAKEHVASCDRCTTIVELVRGAKLVGLDKIAEVYSVVTSVPAGPEECRRRRWRMRCASARSSAR